MNQLTNVFDAFYSRFLLRDLCGKILPGSILLFSIAAIRFSYSQISQFLTSMPWELWIAGAASGWVAGCAVQALGEWSGLLWPFPGQPVRWAQQRHNIIVRGFAGVPSLFLRSNRMRLNTGYINVRSFGMVASPGEQKLLERFVVIKEACGNTSLALFGALIARVAKSLIALAESGVSFDLPGLLVTLSIVIAWVAMILLLE